MARKKKQNKLQTLVLTLAGAILLALFMSIPLMLIGYTWMVYALKEIPLWIAIVVSALTSLAEALMIVSSMEK